MGKIILTESPLGLETRRKSAIDNHMSRAVPYAGLYDEQKFWEGKFPNAHRRQVGPSNTYNCHGLTFGARRTAIKSGVPEMLSEDDYIEIERKDVEAGDVVIYLSASNGSADIIGDIEHSGIVLEKTALGSIRVLSKWGFGDEWVHFLSDCPYNSSNVRFFRINDCPRTRPRR